VKKEMGGERAKYPPVLGDHIAAELDLLLASAAELLEGALELALQRRRLAHDGAGEFGEGAAPSGVAGAVHLVELPRRRAGRRPPRVEAVAPRPLHAWGHSSAGVREQRWPLGRSAVVAYAERRRVLLLMMVQERLRQSRNRNDVTRHFAQFCNQRTNASAGEKTCSPRTPR
jgi:hypothetical protein